MSATNRAGYESLPFLIPAGRWSASSSVLTALEALPVPSDVKIDILDAVIESVRDDADAVALADLVLTRRRLRVCPAREPAVFADMEALIERLRVSIERQPAANPFALLNHQMSRRGADYNDAAVLAYHALLRPHAPRAVPEPGASGRVDLFFPAGSVSIEANSTWVRVTRGERVLMDASVASVGVSVAGSTEPRTDADRVRVTDYSRSYAAELAGEYRGESVPFFPPVFNAQSPLAYTNLNDDTYTLRVPDREFEMNENASSPAPAVYRTPGAALNPRDAVVVELEVVAHSVEVMLGLMAAARDQTAAVGDWVEYSPVLRRILRRVPRREFPSEKMQPGQTMIACGRISRIDTESTGLQATVLGPRGALVMDLPAGMFPRSHVRPLPCASPGCRRSRSVNLPFCSDHCRSGPTEQTVYQAENRALAIRHFNLENGARVPSEFAPLVRSALSAELDILTQYVLDGRAAIQRAQQAAARREQLALQRAARTAETDAALERQRELETLKALMAKHGVNGTLPGEPPPRSNEPGQRFLDL